MAGLTRRFSLVWLLPIAVLAGLIALFFNKMAFTNLILGRGDTFLYFYPYWHSAAGALGAARIPFWNPAIFMGAPLLANSQAGFFYPPNWPVWLLLETPYAVSASILLHLLIASIGVYMLGRRQLELGTTAALVAAASFALGGYFSAQVEHINQVQGLAWLPWLLLAITRVRPEQRRTWWPPAVLIGVLFALQLIAGHTQTVFISGVALLIWLAASWIGQRYLQPGALPPVQQAAPLGVLAAGVLVAFGLASVQLVPTMELAQYSGRQGGLPPNEVLSFSLPLHALARSLLPTYGQSLFSEYVAFVPLTVLALAFVGAWQWRWWKGVLPAVALAGSGLFLALGAYNPLYWLLARLPGFNLFRAPARWLVLYALGVALLAGFGWQLLERFLRDSDSDDPGKRLWQAVKAPLLAFLVVVLLLAVWGFAAAYVQPWLPAGTEAPYERPTALTVSAWAIEVGLVLALVAWFSFSSSGISRRLVPALLVIAAAAAFLASRSLPYNNLTTPEAFFDLRPAASSLIAAGGDPPGRLLSLSDIFFDPGDLAEIDSIYAAQLPPEAIYDYVVAIKQKEIIAPNLPMIYGLASVDGFDGGILPLRAYSALMSALLTDGQVPTDGRLREYLDAVPAPQWLDLFNTRYVVTDKTGDLWRDGVYYDRQHPLTLAGDETMLAGYLPPFEATELRLLASAQPGVVMLETSAGDRWDLLPDAAGDGLYRFAFPAPAIISEATVGACPAEQPCVLEGAALVDNRDGAFLTLTPGNYRLIYSGDVKVYENQDVLPRAYLVGKWQWAADETEALRLLQEAGFEAREMAVLVAPARVDIPPEVGPAAAAGQAMLIDYDTERVVIMTESAGPTMLIVSDALYPGWQATVDGRPVPIYQANGLFRAVYLPAGPHEVVFEFVPASFRIGLILFIFTAAILALVSAWWAAQSRRQS